MRNEKLVLDAVEPSKRGPWLFRGFVGDEILPSYVGYVRIPINQPGFNGKSSRGFFLTQLEDLEHNFLEKSGGSCWDDWWKVDSKNSLIAKKSNTCATY